MLHVLYFSGYRLCRRPLYHIGFFELENGTVSQTITLECHQICVNFIVYLIEIVRNPKIPEHMFRYVVQYISLENRFMKRENTRNSNGGRGRLERMVNDSMPSSATHVYSHPQFTAHGQSTEHHIGGRYGLDHMATGCCHMIPQSQFSHEQRQ